MLVPGVAPVTLRARLERLLQAPLRPLKPQKPLNIGLLCFIVQRAMEDRKSRWGRAVSATQWAARSMHS